MQCVQSRVDNVAAIHLKETPQIFACIRTAKSVRSKYRVIDLWQVGTDLFSKGTDIICCGNHRAFVTLKTLCNPGSLLLCLRVQAVVRAASIPSRCNSVKLVALHTVALTE